jgi:acetyl esterase/lipase
MSSMLGVPRGLRREAWAAAVVLLATLAARPAVAQVPTQLENNQNIPLWPAGEVPLATGDEPLDVPFLTVFLPPEGQRTDAAVIVAPGGGNIMMMYGVEGFEVAERYNDWGVTAFVLTYRLQPYDNDARVLDGQRAVRLVRAHAADWGLNPETLGFIGFSAGSNLGRSVVASAGPGMPDAPDPIERVGARPDYLVLVYGAGRPTPEEDLSTFPPTFLLSAAADRGPSLGNAQLFADLVRAGAIAEIHVYQQGRHGFGGGFGSKAFSGWMPQLRTFLEVGGFLPAGSW